MGRFLTPSKVALLVLAQIYTKGSIPLSGTTKVLSILISRILLDSKESSELLRRQDSDTILDLENDLASQPSAIPGRTVWDILLKDLWVIDCADSLDWFITDIPLLLGKTRDDLLRERDEGIPPEPAGKIVRTSPLGVFIRRCSIEYQRLQFQDSTALWMDFVAYRMPSKNAYTRKNPHTLRNAFDVNLADLQIDETHPLTGIMFRHLIDNAQATKALSTYDSEKLMEFQVSEMQSIGGRLPGLMRTRLKSMATLGPSTPKLTHYLSFLDSWRAGSFTSALDSLHRYFDYTMQSRDRTFYQYALLNLAILQADFGCHAEAIAAMTEAIATARENRDTVCLNYCMSWLYHFGRAFPAQIASIKETQGILGNEVEGLNFLKSRAKEAEMWTLLSTSLLSEAKISLQHGESLAGCFENIIKASHINIVKNIPNSTGPALLMKSTFFSRVGQTHLAFSCGERFLLCHMTEAPLEDILKCTIRQAMLLAQMGRLSDSQATLSTVSENVLQVLKYNTHLTTSTLILRSRRLLHRNNLNAAQQTISKLVSQQPHPDIETSTQVSLLEIDLLTRQRQFTAALGRLETLADTTALENNDVLLKTRLLTIKATLYAKSDKAHNGFSLAMRAVQLAFQARALPGLWEACLALSIILIDSYEFAAAQDLLSAILPQVLECLDCDLAGRTYLVLADCYVGLAGLEGSKSVSHDDTSVKEDKKKNRRSTGAGDGGTKQKQKQLMSSAMEVLEKAGEQFRWVEELEGQLEVLAKMGRICAWRGDAGLASEFSDKYVELRRRYEEEEEI